ncbi:MAG TPA: peptide-methionine (R)-S-oxide reductase MsrB [Gammaproteobacteria bacterium]
MNDKVVKSDKEWRAQLSPEQYYIARQQGTEPAFTGQYHAHKEPGIYHCVGCGAALFGSNEKFDSGSGWPSYWAPYSENAVNTHRDLSHGMARVEVRCAKCAGHLGHVFDDGPAPSGLRYCINSAVLDFKPNK